MLSFYVNKKKTNPHISDIVDIPNQLNLKLCNFNEKRNKCYLVKIVKKTEEKNTL